MSEKGESPKKEKEPELTEKEKARQDLTGLIISHEILRNGHNLDKETMDALETQLCILHQRFRTHLKEEENEYEDIISDILNEPRKRELLISLPEEVLEFTGLARFSKD